MKTAAEIEAELSQAAQNMKALQKAAKDQAAKNTAEPADLPRGLPGDLTGARPPAVPNR